MDDCFFIRGLATRSLRTVAAMDARLRRASIAPVRSSTTEELNVGVASPDKADKLRRKFQAAKVEAVDWTAFE